MIASLVDKPGPIAPQGNSNGVLGVGFLSKNVEYVGQNPDGTTFRPLRNVNGSYNQVLDPSAVTLSSEVYNSIRQSLTGGFVGLPPVDLQPGYIYFKHTKFPSGNPAGGYSYGVARISGYTSGVITYQSNPLFPVWNQNVPRP